MWIERVIGSLYDFKFIDDLKFGRESTSINFIFAGYALSICCLFLATQLNSAHPILFHLFSSFLSLRLSSSSYSLSIFSSIFLYSIVWTIKFHAQKRKIKRKKNIRKIERENPIKFIVVLFLFSFLSVMRYDLIRWCSHYPVYCCYCSYISFIIKEFLVLNIWKRYSIIQKARNGTTNFQRKIDTIENNCWYHLAVELSYLWRKQLDFTILVLAPRKELLHNYNITRHI